MGLTITVQRHSAACDSEADFEVFRPAGASRCTDEGAKFHSHRRNDNGIGPPKLKFLLIFDQNVEYKRPAEVYPLRDFYKICRMCTSFIRFRML